MTPLLSPRKEIIAAFLQPGQALRHIKTGQLYQIDRVNHCLTNTEECDGFGRPFRKRQGYTLAVKVGDKVWREVGSGPKLANIWSEFEPPEIKPALYRAHHRWPTNLSDMERAAGFEFYGPQRELIHSVACVPGALVAAETGAGKTLIGIAIAYLLQRKRALFLVPQGVMGQWRAEFARFWPGQEIHRLTEDAIRHSQITDGIWMAYHQEMLFNDGGLVRKLAPDAFDMVIVDEGHLVMNPETHMGDALALMKPANRYVLTATPVPNRLREIYPLCRWIRPDIDYKYNVVREWRGTPGGRMFEVDPIEPLSAPLFAAELSQVVAAVRKVDIRPDLPECRITLVRHPMAVEQASRYDWYKRNWTLPSGDSGTVARVRLNHLRSVCAEGESIKCEDMVRRVHRLVGMGEKVVIACARTEQSDWIESVLRAPVYRIDSTEPSDDHSDEASRFKAAKSGVMLLGLKCAYGYSFSDCAHMLIGSPEWGLGTALQTLGRVWRLDSQRPVNCEVHVCGDTIEEDVVINTACKEGAANAVLYGSSAPTLLPANVNTQAA